MKRIILNTLLILIFSFVLVPSDAFAAKLLPRYKAGGKSSFAGGVGVSAKLRSDRKAVILSLSNVKKTRSITYTLIYKTNGKDEGVSGTIDGKAGNNSRRELLFGTCSAGVCRYHQNISNTSLEVVIELSSGKKTLKRFRIRV